MIDGSGGKTGLASGDTAPEKFSRLSPVKEGIYGCMVWLMYGCAVYTFLYISMPRTMIPATIAILLRIYGQKKFGLALVPRPLNVWWKSTRLYELFSANIKNDKKILRYRDIGLYCLIVAIGVWLLRINYPPLTLKDMMVFQGHFAGYVRMPHHRYSCGDIVNFRLSDGRVVQCWEYVGKSGADEKFYQQLRGDELTVWVEPGKFVMAAHCRRFLSVVQVEHKSKLVKVFNPENRMILDKGLGFIAKWLFVIGSLCLLRVWWATRNTGRIMQS